MNSFRPIRLWKLAECKPELNRIVAVQECDARMLNSHSIAGYIKNKFCTAGFFDLLFRNFNSKTICHDYTSLIYPTIIARGRRAINAKNKFVCSKDHKLIVVSHSKFDLKPQQTATFVLNTNVSSSL